MFRSYFTPQVEFFLLSSVVVWLKPENSNWGRMKGCLPELLWPKLRAPWNLSKLNTRSYVLGWNLNFVRHNNKCSFRLRSCAHMDTIWLSLVRGSRQHSRKQAHTWTTTRWLPLGSSSRHHSPACCFLFSARHTIPLPTWPPSKSSPKLSSYRNIFFGLGGVGPGEGRDPWTWRSPVVYLHPFLHNNSTRLVRAVEKWRTAYCCQLYFQPKPRNWLDKEIMQPTQRHWIIFPNRRRLTLHRTILP